MNDRYIFNIIKQSARNGAGWAATVHYNDQLIAHALIRDFEIDSVEIVWFTVNCQYRMMGVGYYMVQQICSYFPNKKVYAKDIIDSGRKFWNRMIQLGLIQPDNTFIDDRMYPKPSTT